MEFVTGQELSIAIQAVLAGRRKDMAVAFWGRGACDRLTLPPDASGSRVACDARSGGCNPSALADLLERNVTIRDVSGLHAKVYIGDKGAVICSANASANGLGEESKELFDSLEAGYVTEQQEDIEKALQWFRAIYDQGDDVTKSDLPEIRALWRERQKHRPARSKRLLDALRNAPDQLRGRGLKVAIYTSVDPPPSVERAYKQSVFYDAKTYRSLSHYPFFWDAKDWKVGVGDLILCFEGDEQRKIACYGTWRVQAVIDGGIVVPAGEYVRDPFRLKLPQSDARDLAKQVQSLVNGGVLEMDGPLLAIEAFAQKLRKSGSK